MNVRQGELYSLGPNLYLDDEYIHLYGRRTKNEVNQMWRDWFDGLYTDRARVRRVTGAERRRRLIRRNTPIRGRCGAPGCGAMGAGDERRLRRAASRHRGECGGG